MNFPLTFHLAMVAGLLLAVALVVQILRSRRPPAAAMGWLVFIATLPYLGIPLYLAFGTRKLPGRQRLGARASRPADPPLDRLLDSLGMPPATRGNRLLLHRDGNQARAAIEDMLRTAHHSVDLCVYQLQDDQTVGSWLDRFAELARRGVRVRLLVDAVGSWSLPRKRCRHLQAAGVRLERFIPVLHRPLRGRTNLRNHRKLLLVDGAVAWTGGRNLAAPYFTGNSAWIDLSLSLRGPAVGQLQDLFERDWAFATGAPAIEPPALPPGQPTDNGVRLITSGPDTAYDPIHATLLTAIHAASRRVLAVTPYYVPDDCLQQALCLAARRGVTVDLVLPARSNHPSADIARSRHLRELHGCGARIWLLDKPMVHAKAMVIDDNCGITGSANLDLRSLFLNFELALVLRDPVQVQTLGEWVDRLRHRAIRHRPARANPLREGVEGIVLLLGYQL